MKYTVPDYMTGKERPMRCCVGMEGLTSSLVVLGMASVIGHLCMRLFH